jgi:predicted Fe-Mo cluster-binding NifX family protein
MQGASFSEHFGGASHFRLIDADLATRHIISQTDVQAPEHVPGAFPEWLAQQGVKAVIVGGIGKRAVQLFVAHGIPVFIAQPGATPEDLVSRQLEGGLAQPNLEDCCPGHGHDHGNEHSSCAH